MVASGDYQRFNVIEKQRYFHLISPNTLIPEAHFCSVNMFAGNAGYCDFLSTRLYLSAYDMPAKHCWDPMRESLVGLHQPFPFSLLSEAQWRGQ